jgi:putative endonuclease
MTEGYVCIMNNHTNTTLYTGVTSNLIQRVYQHRNGLVEGFTRRYNLKKLVYFESYESIVQAIEREKQIKAGSRKKKIKLIESANPEWKDIFNTIL